MRPDRVVVALGTTTGVGKTWVGAGVLAELRTGGVKVAGRKPVQSFAPDEGPTDAEVLAAASGERAADVCPLHRWYEVAMAPPVAAARLGRPPFTLDDLLAELRWPPDVEVGWVETAGGPRSPLAVDGDGVALAVALAADLAVLVADAGLGAINAVRLSASALSPLSVPLVVVLNRYAGDDPVHRSNRDWLRDDGFDVLTGIEDLVGRVGKG